MKPEFDPKRLLATLADHKIRFIVIGGVAATVHDSPYATYDLDICPDPDDENLRRLAAALEDLDAKMRFTDEPEPVGIDFTPRVLRSAPFLNLVTRFGPLDIVNDPTGTGGFADLVRDAEEIELDGRKVSVASRSDVLRSKEAIYRDKDIPTIRLFRELEERELGKRSGRRQEPPSPDQD